MNTDINQGTYKIFLCSTCIYIQHPNINKLLKIEHLGCKISETSLDSIKNVNIYATIKPHAILGILKINTQNFLAIVKSTEYICTLEGNDIFKVKEADFISLSEDRSGTNFSNDVNVTLTGMKNFLTLGFFYSFNYDLTNKRQRLSKFDNIYDINNCEQKFFWNYNLYKGFFEMNVNKIWMTVMICGYVGSLKETINNVEVAIYLISRRSVHHAGTRYNTRGIDDSGHVANYCEIEQIVKVQNHIISSVQIRGSVPVFFQQIGMTAQTQITRSPEMAAPAFLKHIEEIQKDYEKILGINLMNVNKPGEQIITQSYESQIKLNKLKSVRYIFFDFQNECKHDNYDQIDNMLDNLNVVFNIFKFFCQNINTKEIPKEQVGIVRTNCLDCLDRTNVIQTRVAWRMLELQLTFLNINTEGVFNTNFMKADKEKKILNPLMQSFKEIWAENGDFISIQYAGTASTISNVTKTGSHGIYGVLQHGLVTVTRFYQGTFEDDFKQQCMDLLLQKYNDPLLLTPQIEEKLKQLESKFVETEELILYIGSWNTGGIDIKDNMDLNEWLYPNPIKDMRTPDIYIICLQEIVNLNAKNIIISSNAKKVDQWRNILTKVVNFIDKYTYLQTLDLVGIFFIVFVKDNLRQNIKNIDENVIRTGMMGTMGNKGSCLIRFNYHDTSLVFSGGHFSADANNNRIQEFNNILSQTFNKDNKRRDMKFKDHDIQFVFGDLNFRLDLESHTAKMLISNQQYKDLLTYDQFIKARHVNSSLIEFKEGNINFDPTYKYDVGTNTYDTSKKKRVPAWCDRILFRKTEDIETICYNIVNYTQSDHKPIYGVYKIKTKKVIEEERQKLIKELKETMNLGVDPDSQKDINSFMSENFFNKKTKTSNILHHMILNSGTEEKVDNLVNEKLDNVENVGKAGKAGKADSVEMSNFNNDI